MDSYKANLKNVIKNSKVVINKEKSIVEIYSNSFLYMDFKSLININNIIKEEIEVKKLYFFPKELEEIEESIDEYSGFFNFLIYNNFHGKKIYFLKIKDFDVEIRLTKRFLLEKYENENFLGTLKKELRKSFSNFENIKIKLSTSEDVMSQKNVTDVIHEEAVNKIAEDMKLFEMQKIAKEEKKKADKIKREERIQIIKNADGSIIYGNKILDSPVFKIRELDTIKNYCISGTMEQIDVKELKSGKFIVTFKLFAGFTAIACKFFCESNKLPDLKKNTLVIVKGKMDYDEYVKDFSIMVKDINLGEAVIYEDPSVEKRVELHLHTKMSSLDATVDLKCLFKRLKEYGHQSVAITDHGVVQSFPDAYFLGKSYGIKVIYGMEAYVFDDVEEDSIKGKSNHLIILVKNQQGLEDLYKLVTRAHLDYFYRSPKIPKSLLMSNRENFILGSACEAGELYRAIISGKSDEELVEIAKVYDYLEIQPRSNNQYLVRENVLENEEAILDTYRKVIEIGKLAQKKTVATCDVHYLDNEDGIHRSILMKNKGYDDVTQPDLYYRNTMEMLEEFSYLGEDLAREVVIENPNYVNSLIADNLVPVPQELYPPFIEGAEEQVESITLNTAHEIYGEVLPDVVQARVDKELGKIIQNGFSVLYLIAHKLVKKSNDDGYIVGSRGSVGSSLVATFMNITEVNPLAPHYVCPQCKYSEFVLDGSYSCGVDMENKPCPNCGTDLRKDGFNIPFETFLGFQGEKVPDIDLNFSGEYQGKIHAHTRTIFGDDKVFKAGTIGTVADKTAFMYTKKYVDEMGLNVGRSLDIEAISRGCVGVKRTTGQHPGGLMVIPNDVDVHKFTPLQRPANDKNSEFITTHFDYHSISEKLVKLDLLGHDDPTIIKHLEDLTGVPCTSIPLDSKEVMSLFTSTSALKMKEEVFKLGSLGLPEFGTPFVRAMLLDTKPQVFSDLIRISGFSHGTDVWLNNAQDLIKEGTCKLNEAISTRDDIMIYLIEQGLDPSISFKIMEGVRKGRGLTPEQKETMIQCNIPSWYIKSCETISYMFPKAHATAYVTMAFRLGYYKIYHKEAFYAAFFSVRGVNLDCTKYNSLSRIKEGLTILKKEKFLSSKDKDLKYLLEIALEMYLRDVEFLPIDINKSLSFKFQIIDGKLLPPLITIPGLGEKVAIKIYEERLIREFKYIDDLQSRGRINQSIIDIMKEGKIIDMLPESQQVTMF